MHGRHTDLVGQYRENVCQMFVDSISKMIFVFSFFYLPMAELIKLAKMAGAIHEADHAYSVRSTW